LLACVRGALRKPTVVWFAQMTLRWHCRDSA
jgi:hypothetical protein